MIDLVTYETAHLLGDALPAMFRLRHRVFVEREKYAVPTLRGMEWDQFDTPAAVYLLWRDADGMPRGMARVIPTTFPYMIRELWPQLVEDGPLPSETSVWELTRSGVDRGLDARIRQTIIGETLCALHEFALVNGITRYIQVTHPRVAEYTMKKPGCDVEYVGRQQKLERLTVVASRLNVSQRGLDRLRAHFGIRGPVLRVVGEDLQKAA